MGHQAHGEIVVSVVRWRIGTERRAPLRVTTDPTGRGLPHGGLWAIADDVPVRLA
jgi:hypothetical protein